MPEWLSNSVSLDSTLPSEQVLVRLAVAAIYGACVALIFWASHGRHKDDAPTLRTTLVMLSILVAMVSMVIGDSVARAFSLVGALSIVRFRTVVEDTRDTAFVIFAVVVGMAAGAGLLVVPLIGIPVVGAAALMLGRIRGRPPAAGEPESTLAVRIGLGRDPKLLLDATLSRHLEGFRLTQAATARQGAALDLHYCVRLRSSTSMTTLVAELNQVEGVQGVELRSAS